MDIARGDVGTSMDLIKSLVTNGRATPSASNLTSVRPTVEGASIVAMSRRDKPRMPVPTRPCPEYGQTRVSKYPSHVFSTMLKHLAGTVLAIEQHMHSTAIHNRPDTKAVVS
jgi:hypothetical protein